MKKLLSFITAIHSSYVLFLYMFLFGSNPTQNILIHYYIINPSKKHFFQFKLNLTVYICFHLAFVFFFIRKIKTAFFIIVFKHQQGRWERYIYISRFVFPSSPSLNSIIRTHLFLFLKCSWPPQYLWQQPLQFPWRLLPRLQQHKALLSWFSSLYLLPLAWHII
ncbi:MAG: hypothetical protein A4E27_01038 [Methanobacterium sp. PtaU1.Bin242]|nr:MAG: hypothetical protein A4E27_01038 [Methanobacterium sp. PtaU1.Bin242]